jgi:TrmH family RNA methyltransferase
LVTKAHLSFVRKIGRNSSFRHEKGLFLAEGFKVIQAAIRANALKELFYLPTDSAARSFIKKYGSFNGDVFEINSTQLAYISNAKNPQPVLGLCLIKKYLEDEMLNSELIWVLDDVADPANAGTIIRSISLFSPETPVIVFYKGVDPFNPKVVRSSAGAIFESKIVISKLEKLESFLKAKGFDIVLTAPVGGKDPCELQLLKKSAIVLGNESKGACHFLKAANHIVTIPMKASSVDSLNVSMVATIIAYIIYKKSFSETKYDI